MQSPPPPPSVVSNISQAQYTYGALPALGGDVGAVATSGGADWYHPACVAEFQHQPDCQQMAQPVVAPVMQQQKHDVPNVGPGGPVKTETDAGNQRREPSTQSLQSADEADISTSLTTAAVTCDTGEY